VGNLQGNRLENRLENLQGNRLEKLKSHPINIEKLPENKFILHLLKYYTF
jgi:hypothetical protein